MTTTPTPEDSPRVTATRRLILRLSGHPVEEEPSLAFSMVAICVVILMALLLLIPLGYWVRSASTDQRQVLDRTLDNARAPVVDECTVQWVSALAFERANNRPAAMAPFDRAAWNLSQFHAAKIMREQPHLSEEEMVVMVTNVIQDVYRTPEITHCGPP